MNQIPVSRMRVARLIVWSAVASVLWLAALLLIWEPLTENAGRIGVLIGQVLFVLYIPAMFAARHMFGHFDTSAGPMWLIPMFAQTFLMALCVGWLVGKLQWIAHGKSKSGRSADGM